MITRERCACCYQISAVGFHVPNDMWKEAVHSHFVDSVLCLRCFISFADEKLLRWDLAINFYPVSLWTHLAFAGVVQDVVV